MLSQRVVVLSTTQRTGDPAPHLIQLPTRGRLGVGVPSHLTAQGIQLPVQRRQTGGVVVGGVGELIGQLRDAPISSVLDVLESHGMLFGLSAQPLLTALEQSAAQVLANPLLLATQLIQPLKPDSTFMSEGVLQLGNAIVGVGELLESALPVTARSLGHLLRLIAFAERAITLGLGLTGPLLGGGSVDLSHLGFTPSLLRRAERLLPSGFGRAGCLRGLPTSGLGGIASGERGGQLSSGVGPQGGDFLPHRIQHGLQAGQTFIEGVHVEAGHRLIRAVDPHPDLAVLVKHGAGDGLGAPIAIAAGIGGAVGRRPSTPGRQRRQHLPAISAERLLPAGQSPQRHFPPLLATTSPRRSGPPNLPTH